MELLIIHVVDLAQPSKDVFLHINGSVKWDRVLIIKATVGIGVVEMEFSLSLMLWLYMLLTTWYRSLMHLAWYSTSLWEIINYHC